MSTLDRWLPELVRGADGDADGMHLQSLRLDLPVELRLTRGEVQLRMPSDRLATGFDAPVGRLRLHLERSGDAP